MVSLLPHNATVLERAVEQQSLAAHAPSTQIPTVWDPDRCPVELLPYLAWSLAVDVWDDDWSEAQKRAVIRTAIYVHRHRGTIGAIRRALEALNLGAEITRWFERTPKGDPYTFIARVHLFERPLTEEAIELIQRTILQTKAARSWLEKLTVYLSSRPRPAIMSVAKVAVYLQASPPAPVGEATVQSGAVATLSTSISSGGAS